MNPIRLLARPWLRIVLILGLGTGLALALLNSPKPPEASHDHHDHGSAGHSDDHGKAGHADDQGKAGHADDHGKAGHSDDHDKAGHADDQDEPEHSATQLTDEQLQNYGIRLAIAGPQRLDQYLSLPGTVQLNTDLSLSVVPRVAGRIEQALVNAGDKVKSGQLLAVISSQTVADQRSELLTAQKRHELAQANYRREHQLWTQGISAQQDYLAAKAVLQETEISVAAAQQKLSSLGVSAVSNSRNLTQYQVRAPMDGVILDKNLRLGEVVNAETPIFQISDLERLWVEAQIPAELLPQLRIGDLAQIQTPAVTSPAEARLRYIGNRIHESSRRASIRLELANPSGLWRPGLPVNVNLITASHQVPIAVPFSALQRLNDQDVVFVRSGNQLSPRVVMLGRRNAQLVEVLSGLQAGDSYVTDNSFLIKADIEKAGASHDH